MNSIMLCISIAIAANLDNLGVGIAYGIQKIRISHAANLLIAAISLAATWLSAEVGKAICIWLSPQLARSIGAVLLVGVGLWVLAQPVVTAVRKKKPIVDVSVSGTRIYVGPSEILSTPESADLDKSRDTGWWEAILLGIALSINALAGGFDAGIVGISASVESLMVGLFSFLTVAVGLKFGRNYGAVYLGKCATVISGTLLMLIGMHQMIG